MSDNTICYLDYAAGAPPWPEALDTFTEIAARYIGNPSSSHPMGQMAAKALSDARSRFQNLCGSSSGRLVLTSGGTEANNLLIRGIMDQHPKGRLLLAGDVHPSAWFALDHYAKRVDVLMPEPDGSLSVAALRRSISSRTVLCSVVHGNNETGFVHDLRALGEVCKERKVLFHGDGAQVLGHLAIKLDSLPVDFYTFAAHKFGGPRGVGGLFFRDAIPLPQMAGGGQEKSLRPGTENVAGLASAMRALECSLSILPDEEERLRALARSFVEGIRSQCGEVILNSALESGLPGLVSLSFPGTQATQLVTELGLNGFAISAGSACHSGEVKPSRVIMALGRSAAEALGTIRVSPGRATQASDFNVFTNVLTDIVKRQRALA